MNSTGNQVVLQGQKINLRGEELVVSCSKSLYWPARGTVFVADVHLGKAAAFRARSIPMPHGTTDETFRRLDEVLEETKAVHLVVLGDLWHDRHGKTDLLMERLGAWTASHPSVCFTLVTGNHDIRAGETPRSTGFKSVDELWLDPFSCVHHPVAQVGRYVLSGHIHPGIELGSAKSSLKLPCFAFGSEVGILPAFGEFTGTAPIVPESDEDLICVIAEDKLYTFSGKHLLQRSVRSC